MVRSINSQGPLYFGEHHSNSWKKIRIISGPWSFIRRARCLVGGAIVDDIDYYNRVHEMLHILTSKNNRDNDDVEGFGQRWDNENIYRIDAGLLGGIAKDKSRTVSFKPLFGLFNQPKFLPLAYCPLMMEFEIVNNATDPIVTPGTAYADTSSSWKIKDIRIVCDVVTLDNALQNSYAEHVLSGKALPINYSTYVSQFQTLGTDAKQISVSVTRSVSRLKSVF